MYRDVAVATHRWINTLHTVFGGWLTRALLRKRFQKDRETPVFVLLHNQQHSHNILPTQRLNGGRGRMDSSASTAAGFQLHANVNNVLTN